MIVFLNTYSQSLYVKNDTIYVKEQSQLLKNHSGGKIFIGDTLTLNKGTKKGLLNYTYKHIDKINNGALIAIPLEERKEWKIIVEKIIEKDNRIKIRGKLRNYITNKKGRTIEIGSETGVINDIENAIVSGEIIL